MTDTAGLTTLDNERITIDLAEWPNGNLIYPPGTKPIRLEFSNPLEPDTPDAANVYDLAPDTACRLASWLVAATLDLDFNPALTPPSRDGSTRLGPGARRRARQPPEHPAQTR